MGGRRGCTGAAERPPIPRQAKGWVSAGACVSIAAGELGLSPRGPPFPEVPGGVLADEMGLGEAVSSLLH